MPLDDVAHDPEAQSETVIAGARSLAKPIEHIGKELASNANAMVAYDDLRDDLLSALGNLGYHRQSIDKVLDKLTGGKSDGKFEDVLRAALKDLSRA